MVHIFFYRSLSRLPAGLFEYYLQLLPPSIQKKVLAFKQWQDAERSLAGNILLLKGLQFLDIGGYPLTRIKYAEFEKPYFDDHLHFNISHSGQYTVCAISRTNLAGIDVEEIKQIPLIDFTDFFYEEEWQEVLNADNRLNSFYTLWTKKEAFLKVIGAGLNVPLNKVIIENNRIRWGNSDWLLQEVKLDPTHTCYLCTNGPLPPFEIHEIGLQH
ncbi:MAG: 4'-phosphopantetheinyl transferase superfamily protein [Ferruginibacter sp.]|nr:4'-phosphopantetheinyl transferase superfamily protein [Ferruginibacter sp.]